MQLAVGKQIHLAVMQLETSLKMVLGLFSASAIFFGVIKHVAD